MIDVWNSLKFSTADWASKFAGSVGWHLLHSSGGEFKYRNNRAYKNILVQVAKQAAVQSAAAELDKLLPRYQRMIEKRLRESVDAQREKSMVDLIKKREDFTTQHGRIPVKNSTGQQTIVAKDKYGTPVPEAIILYYQLPDGEKITYEDVIWEGKPESYENKASGVFGINSQTIQTKQTQTKTEFTCSTLAHIDLAPQVSIKSGKQLVMTKVQGRDFSRKELIAGDDITFSISGSIVSDEIDVYPSSAVRKFIQLCQYKGIVEVNHYLINDLNVKRVIITDFNLGTPEFKNIQPYSLSCVAIEPDEDIQVKKDTIGLLNMEIAASEASKWERFVLNNKLAELSAEVTTSIAKESFGRLIDLIPDTQI